MDYHEQKDSLRHQMTIMTERIHYAESRRNGFLIIAGAFFAAGISFMGIGFQNITNIYYYALSCMSILFAIIGVIIWCIFSKQTNYYPFIDIAKNNIWFYRDALEDCKKFNVSFRDYFLINNVMKQKVRDEFINQFYYYKCNSDDYLSNELRNLEIDQHQIYILHVNECYKNQYLSHLGKITYLGIIISLSTFSLIIIILSLLY